MTHPAPTDPVAPARWTTEHYLRLVDEGVLEPDDKVELLEGVIQAVGDRGVVRIQLPLIAGIYSMPEPDAAIVPGALRDYDEAHPTIALLVVEVSDTSLKQDRLTKRAIYAAGGIPEYWIVNLRDHCVEVRRNPEPEERRYASVLIAHRGQRIDLVGLPGVSVAVDDLLPSRVV